MQNFSLREMYALIVGDLDCSTVKRTNAQPTVGVAPKNTAKTDCFDKLICDSANRHPNSFAAPRMRGPDNCTTISRLSSNFSTADRDCVERRRALSKSLQESRCLSRHVTYAHDRSTTMEYTLAIIQFATLLEAQPSRLKRILAVLAENSVRPRFDSN